MATYEQRRMAREGMLFVDSKGKLLDLRQVQVLHKGVDTLRQLYRGIPGRIVHRLAELYDAEIGAILDLGGYRWRLGSGGKSGYRYRLQNNDLGLILFFLSRYSRDDERGEYREGSHLKIEASPQFLHERSARDVQTLLDSLAGELLDGRQAAGLAVHLCVDVQGWTLPKDFEARFVCKSKRRVTHSGISEFALENLGAAVRYGDQETITYGSPSGLQFTVYDKTKAALRQDKIHFWESVWRTTRDDNFQPYYNAEHTVRRIELRFHHTVIRQFSDALAQGVDSEGRPCIYTSQQIRNYCDLQPHLTGLWRYGMQSFRLQYTSTTLDPFWQVLLDDVTLNEHAPDFLYKRQYKKPGRGAEKNVTLALGNMLSLYVRRRLRLDAIWANLKRSGIWDDIVDYYLSRGLTENMLRDHIRQAIEVRVLNGLAA